MDERSNRRAMALLTAFILTTACLVARGTAAPDPQADGAVGASTVKGSETPAVSPAPGDVRAFGMTWCPGGPGRRENMEVGARRVYEIELFDAPPRGAEGLAGSPARYGIVQFADEARTWFTCGLQKASGDPPKHDSLFMDLNRNGSLEEGEALAAKAVFEGLTALEYGAIDLMVGGPNDPRIHRVFVHTNKFGSLYLASHCYTRGRISLGDHEVEAVLIDYNCDGRYGSGKISDEHIGALGPRELDYDLIGWDADGDGKIDWTEQQFIGSYTVWADACYCIDCSPDGFTVVVTPLDLPMGRLRIPAANAFVRLIGPLGPFNVFMPDGAAAVPAGTYRVETAIVWETPDTTGTPRYRKSGEYFERPWTISPGVTTIIEPNELIVTPANEQRYRERIEARSPRPRRPQVYSILHKPLGDLKEFAIDLGDTAAGRRILLCFFDATQRPSRHFVTQLTQLQEHLRHHDLVLGAVSTSPLQTPSLQKWLAEQNLPFALGQIEGDAEQARIQWGLCSLPWLILTDRNQVVTAEGFTVSELDAKIRGTRSPTDAAEDPDKAVITVTDKQGNPLTDVHVTETETQEQFTTDVKGQFICKPSHQMRFFCAVDRHHALALIGRLGPGQRQLNMELLPARVVSGRVTDPNNRPLAGVQIAPLPMSSFCTLTNEEGQFDIGWLPDWEPQGGLCLMARHVERNLAALVDISRQAVRVDIQLAPALALSGTVTAAEGTPLSGATVSLILRKWNWGCGTPVKRAVTDRSGRFTLPALPQLQEYELHARAADYVAAELTTGIINVVKDREEIGPIVLVKRVPPDTTNEMGRLRLRIVDENLKPVDVTSVQIWKKQPDGGARAESVLLVSTRTPGLYEIEPIPVAKYHALSIHAEGFAPFRLSDIQVRKEPPDTITCQLSRGGTLQGIVTDDAGRPVAGLPVVVSSILCRRDLKTDLNGYFEAPHLPDTHYSVIVEPPSESPYATTVLRGGASCGAKDLHIVVGRKKEVKSPRSLVGTSIWQLTQLILPFEPSTVTHKAILLCLFDVDQRPSRNCLQHLGKRAKELAEKGVVTVAVQVPTVDRPQLDRWLGENAIPFPVGMIQDLDDRTREAWGIRALPWLILTDRNHVIIAEGVTLDALNQKLEEDGGSASDTDPAAGDVTEPNAADLVTEVRASEDWLHRINSLQFRVEGTWSHPPESIAARRAELRQQDPNREPDPRYDASLRPRAGDSLEYAIDFAKQRLRYVQSTATEDHFLQIWDGEQLVCHSIRADGHEEYSLGLSKEPLDRIFGSLSWPRAQPHSFWWAPQDVEQLIGMYGRPQDFRSTGRAEYRGVPCYVLEFDPPDTPGQTIRWYIGRKDRLLYGRTGELFEHWTVDYREIAPNCWIPMTQGYSITRFDQDRKKHYVRLQRDARIVDVRINEELPEALFQMEWKEGIYVVDRRSGETVVSKYVDVPPSLLGRPLPDAASLRTPLTAEQVAGRKILLCFWDMNQRPSRRCLTEVAAGYERLRNQDVAVVAVDMSETDSESLDRWKPEQEIPFPLGKADGDLRKVRQTWGVRSLPWLILTDAEHVVRAEGFALGELPEKLKAAAGP